MRNRRLHRDEVRKRQREKEIYKLKSEMQNKTKKMRVIYKTIIDKDEKKFYKTRLELVKKEYKHLFIY